MTTTDELRKVREVFYETAEQLALLAKDAANNPLVKEAEQALAILDGIIQRGEPERIMGNVRKDAVGRDEPCTDDSSAPTPFPATPQPDEAELYRLAQRLIHETQTMVFHSESLTTRVMRVLRPHLRFLPAEVDPTEDEFLAALQSTINNHWETSMSTPEIARRIRAALSDAGFTVTSR